LAAAKMVFAAAALGRLISRAPLSLNRRASQWIAATILKVTSGSVRKARSSAALVRLRRVPVKVAASGLPRSRHRDGRTALSGPDSSTRYDVKPMSTARG
jgi:hypothetical protein